MWNNFSFEMRQGQLEKDVAFSEEGVFKYLQGLNFFVLNLFALLNFTTRGRLEADS